jgi:hypothetical protein
MIHDRTPEKAPVASEEMKLLLISFLALRAQHGKKWCRDYGVGEFRRFLGDQLPDNVTPIFHAKKLRTAAEGDASRNLKKLFASHCRECGRCKFARA